MIKDFNFYDEKCGTCLTIGYIVSAAVAAILASIVGGSTITQIIIFLIAAVALGFAANKYCMGKVTDEEAAEDVSATAKSVAARVETAVDSAVESVREAAPGVIDDVKEAVEDAVETVREVAVEAAETVREAAEDAYEKVTETVETTAEKARPAEDDRSAALNAAKSAAEAEARAKAAMAKAVADLEAKKKG